MEHAEVSVEGMTCAACVTRIEKALAKTEGVSRASVNLITKRATIDFDPARASRDAIVRAIEDVGYRVGEEPKAGAPDHEARDRARDALVAGAIALPLVAIGMSHVMSSTARFVELALATILLAGPGRTFFVSAWKAARHAAADMNTLGRARRGLGVRVLGRCSRDERTRRLLRKPRAPSSRSCCSENISKRARVESSAMPSAGSCR